MLGLLVQKAARQVFCMRTQMKESRARSTRAEDFAARLGIRLPILLAPMAGACPPSLSIAVANAGGMGACGALLMKPEEIATWCAEFRQQSKGEFQINLWIPGPPPKRDAELERRQREYLAQWGPPVPESAAEGVLPDFEAQCKAMLDAKPKVISSIMGTYAPVFVAEMKKCGILWFATATTVTEARSGGSCGSRCDYCAGYGGRRTSRRIRCERSRAAHGGPVRAVAAGCGRCFGSCDCCGRDWRCTRSGCCADSGGECGDDRDGISALSRGEG